jgi:hypothetical protein
MPSIHTTSQAARTPAQSTSSTSRSTKADTTTELDIQRKLGQERARQSATQVTVSREAAAALKQQQTQQRDAANQDKAVQAQAAQQRSAQENAAQANPQNAAPAQRENTRKAVENAYQSTNASEQGRLKAVYA